LRVPRPLRRYRLSRILIKEIILTLHSVSLRYQPIECIPPNVYAIKYAHDTQLFTYGKLTKSPTVTAFVVCGFIKR